MTNKIRIPIIPLRLNSGMGNPINGELSIDLSNNDILITDMTGKNISFYEKYKEKMLEVIKYSAGSSTNPIYYKDGKPVASSGTVGSTSKPVYLNKGAVSACSATVGSTSKPIYMKAGAMTECSDTVGSTSKPIYMNAGTITECSANVGSTSKPIYMKAGVMTECSDTVGSATQPVYINAGTITKCSYTLGKSVPSNAVFTDTTYSTGTASALGLTKLYTGTGSNTDGTMTQKAISNALNGKAPSSHNHTKSQITDFPSSLPASDVYSWAKQSTKPSYSWSEINDKPGAFPPSSHSHDYIPTSASCNKNWNWSGQSGQPWWLWGSNDGSNMYVYNPSNFNVNYANSAGSVAWSNVSGKPISGISSGTSVTDTSIALSATHANPNVSGSLAAQIAGKANSSHTHNYAGSSGAGGDAYNSNKWGGYNISIVGSLPSSTDANTIYFIRE